MSTFSKIPLSQSSNGRPINISLSASTGIALHSTGTNNTDLDEVWLYGTNVSTSDALLTIMWGSSASANSIGTFTIEKYSGPILLTPGFVLRGTGVEANTIYSYSSSPSAVSIIGFINRITA